MKTIRANNPGPYARTNLRHQGRRMVEGWMPVRLWLRFNRLAAALRFRVPLREVPKPYVVLHSAWASEADVAWAETMIVQRRLPPLAAHYRS